MFRWQMPSRLCGGPSSERLLHDDHVERFTKLFADTRKAPDLGIAAGFVQGERPFSVSPDHTNQVCEDSARGRRALSKARGQRPCCGRFLRHRLNFQRCANNRAKCENARKRHSQAIVRLRSPQALGSRRAVDPSTISAWRAAIVQPSSKSLSYSGFRGSGSRASRQDPPRRRRGSQILSFMIATARVNPAEAPLILNGKQAISKPVGGNASRFVSFSIWP